MAQAKKSALTSPFACIQQKQEPGYSFEDTTIGGAIPKRFMASIDIGIRESMANGILRGYPIVGVRVEVHGGFYHDTDSTDAAFRTAAAMAFQEAAKKAQPLGTGASHAGRRKGGRQARQGRP